MSVSLTSVDLIRDRLPVSYEEARDALAATGGDVADALALLDAGHRSPAHLGADVIDEVKRVLETGPLRGVRFRLGSHTFQEIPLRVSVIGAILVGVAAVLATRLAIDISCHEDKEP